MKVGKGPLEDKPIEKKIVTATAEAVPSRCCCFGAGNCCAYPIKKF
jgi:hypothetical protein